jgi:hypothetical protein
VASYQQSVLSTGVKRAAGLGREPRWERGFSAPLLILIWRRRCALGELAISGIHAFCCGNSGGTWNVSLIYSFWTNNNGYYTGDGVVLDSAGNIYGTTENGSTDNDGTVFELSPS